VVEVDMSVISSDPFVAILLLGIRAESRTSVAGADAGDPACRRATAPVPRRRDPRWTVNTAPTCPSRSPRRTSRSGSGSTIGSH